MLKCAAQILIVVAISRTLNADDLSSLSREFWQWRAATQPFSDDDIPRIERPPNFAVDWSNTAMEKRRSAMVAFENRWATLRPSITDPIAKQVDHRLLGSALTRVHWELDVTQSWRRNPMFYVDQTLGSVYLLLLPPPPFRPERQRELVARMEDIPRTLSDARGNLQDMRAPFARLAVDALTDIRPRCDRMLRALAPELDEATNQRLQSATTSAVTALEEFRSWLAAHLPSLPEETAIGRDNYIYFLRNVALMPYSPEQLLTMSRQEWSRTVAFEAYEQNRNHGVPALPLIPDQQTQIVREQTEEAGVRRFLEEKGILSVPGWLRHYRNLPLPAYVEPFASLSVTDDLTGPSRLDQDGTSYIRKPSPNLGFFALASAHDPRPILVHEGVPGHYFQLCLSWKNPDEIRRHYYDSGANEGIGFYAEEMMLQAGYFDDSPHTREIIYSFMRLRALRVEVDVKLALGTFTLKQAAQYLAQTVPMDQTTALEEAAAFASAPGQAISYQIGKAQILALLADARRAQGDKFRLKTFHDFVWTNGNVLISLQRWELLRDASDVPTPVSMPGFGRLRAGILRSSGWSEQRETESHQQNYQAAKNVVPEK